MRLVLVVLHVQNIRPFEICFSDCLLHGEPSQNETSDAASVSFSEPVAPRGVIVIKLLLVSPWVACIPLKPNSKPLKLKGFPKAAL